MNDNAPGRADAPVMPSQIRFHYIKSNHYRVIHVDGAFGGISTRGLIHVDLFSERNAIPQTMSHQVHPDGRIGEEIAGETVRKEGVVREVEVGATMDLETAKSLIEWLQQKVDALEAHRLSARESA